MKMLRNVHVIIVTTCYNGFLGEISDELLVFFGMLGRTLRKSSVMRHQALGVDVEQTECHLSAIAEESVDDDFDGLFVSLTLYRDLRYLWNGSESSLLSDEVPGHPPTSVEPIWSKLKQFDFDHPASSDRFAQLPERLHTVSSELPEGWPWSSGTTAGCKCNSLCPLRRRSAEDLGSRSKMILGWPWTALDGPTNMAYKESWKSDGVNWKKKKSNRNHGWYVSESEYGSLHSTLRLFHSTSDETCWAFAIARQMIGSKIQQLHFGERSHSAASNKSSKLCFPSTITFSPSTYIQFCPSICTIGQLAPSSLPVASCPRRSLAVPSLRLPL